MKAFDEDAANARQLDIARRQPDPGTKRNQSGYTLDLFSNRIRCFEPVRAPPRVKITDLRFRKLSDFNVQR